MTPTGVWWLAAAGTMATLASGLSDGQILHQCQGHL